MKRRQAFSSSSARSAGAALGCALWLLSCAGSNAHNAPSANQGGAAAAAGASAGGAAGSPVTANGGMSGAATSQSGSSGALVTNGGGGGGGGAPASGGAESSGGSLSSGGSVSSPGGGGSSGDAAGSGGAVSNGGASAGAAGVPAAGGSAGATASAGSGGVTSVQWNATLPKFAKHTIASFSGGYNTFSADIDRDGLKDVVALSSASAGLVWFKNPSWKKYTITTQAKQLIHAAPYDVDGDGDLDLALSSDFDTNNSTSGGTISWLEAPTDATQNQDWPLHRIDAIPTTHRVAWADLDGDGKKELLALPIFGEGSSAPAHAGAVHLTAYTIAKDPKSTWASRVIDGQHLEVAHAIQILDWDGDERDDFLTAANDGVDLFRPSSATPFLHLGAGKEGQAPDRGSSEVGLGHLGSQRFLATIEFWHGTDAVLYTPGASESSLWTRQVLASDFEHGHGLAVADLNADGYDEIVGGGGQGAMKELIFRYVPSTGKWDKVELDSGAVAVSAIEAIDLNGDGALDLLSIGASPTNNVVWYESTH